MRVDQRLDAALHDVRGRIRGGATRIRTITREEAYYIVMAWSVGG
jgi:hypothetical protein